MTKGLGAAQQRQPIGPLLYFRGLDRERAKLAVLFVVADGDRAPALSADSEAVAPVPGYRYLGWRAFHYSFSLPAVADTGYAVDGVHYPVNAAFQDDLRFAYVSCNGMEFGDRERDRQERNPLWLRLAKEHGRRPFQLLLQGGDQIYADEMLRVHPLVRAWARSGRPRGISEEELAEVREALRGFLFRRYLEIYRYPKLAWLLARVPSVCMWDDHDICDGWGSLRPRQLDAPVGRTVFEVARELFLLFQFGSPHGDPPPICSDRSGETLSWSVRLPGVGLVAPDLRSERRPNRVMGAAGWKAFRAELAACDAEQILVLSSVPALGPRLSWIERILRFVPRMQKYEDDLRDQWQSRSHRNEWRTFLRELLACCERRGNQVTVLSGEIHLATRGTMPSNAGTLHQLVASGIAHPPPPGAYARILSALAFLGESPLPKHPIRLHPLPGQSTIYTAQRNFLVLERATGRWQAYWELEHDGATPPLRLDE